MSSKTWIIIAVAVIAIIGIWYYFKNKSTQQVSSYQSASSYSQQTGSVNVKDMMNVLMGVALATKTATDQAAADKAASTTTTTNNA